MRYLGNKARLLPRIAQLMKAHHLAHVSLADLFSGSGNVSDYFKNNFKIIANDYMTYAKVFTSAKVHNSKIPAFKKFKELYHQSPYQYFNNYNYQNSKAGFITNNYSPVGHRMFFTKSNAIKIDTIRTKLSELRLAKVITHKEFIFLLASLLESVMRYSNTSGTYSSYFKKWERRAVKVFKLKPLELNQHSLYSKHNQVYSTDTNQLARQIHGDVAYLDPPYNSHGNYASEYNVLNTIALDDCPSLHGKTGIRDDVKENKSSYSSKRKAKDAFEDLLRQLNFKHIIISYSTQSIIPLNELVKLCKKFAVNHQVEVHYINFREYENICKYHHSHKKSQLKEVLIYFDKDLKTVKSPLNYDGSKDNEMIKLIHQLPKHISNFVDCCGGAFNVGQNIIPIHQVFYNDNNYFVYSMVKMLLNTDCHTLIKSIRNIVKRFNLKPRDKNTYIRFRNYYNSIPLQKRPPILLYVLTLYSFSNMIRFNSKGGFNSPVGKTGVNDEIIHRIQSYHTKAPVGKLTCLDFSKIKFKDFDKDTLFYFDPPYIITDASYNDRKRFKSEWTKHNEDTLLKMLDDINRNGQKFMLSNVIHHHGKTNHQLVKWLKHRKYRVVTIGITGKINKRVEVVVRNY